MGRKRKPAPILQLDFPGLVDVVTLKPKPYWIPQYLEDENGKVSTSFAEILSSRVISRQPRPLSRRARAPEFLSDRFAEHKHQKWCSCCAEWGNRLDFAENRSQRDGLQKWCKACANRHARRMYWLMKDAKKQAA